MSVKGRIELDGLRKVFDDITAVDGVDLEIRGGEFFTLLGPSGCGKTTTLRCIAGLETPTDGSIELDDEVVTHLPANQRNTSMIFQEWALFPHMTVGENVAFGLEMQGIEKSRRNTQVREVLELVELGGYEDREVTDLSGGQKQRVAMARSLVQEPNVLLLDEPLASLDRSLRERLQVELKQIQKDLEITFLHVTHDQEEALTMSDCIAVMNQGQIEQVGTPRELYERPNSQFVAEFLGETNLFEGTVRRNGERVWLEDDDGFRIDLTDSQSSFESDIEETTAGFTVRPETFDITDGAALKTVNEWQGRVETTIYKGSLILYEVRVNDRLFKVQQTRTRAASIYDAGTDVTIGFSSSEGALIHDSK